MLASLASLLGMKKGPELTTTLSNLEMLESDPMQELGLPVDASIPVLGFIGRLDYQKGVDLITESYDWLMDQGVQLIMLGSGREDLENALRYVAYLQLWLFNVSSHYFLLRSRQAFGTASSM